MGPGMDKDFKEQLDDFERKMAQHRTKIREHAQEAQEQVEQAEQRERDSGKTIRALGNVTDPRRQAAGHRGADR